VQSAVFAGPRPRFDADITVPGDKSLTHRALALAALASGTSRVVGGAPGTDAGAMLAALEALGVTPEGDLIRSPGADNWLDPPGALDLENSGTALRLLTGALAGHRSRIVLTGDASLRCRPMTRLVEPLAQLGARIEVSPTGTPPVITGGARLRGAEVRLTLASAQIRSAVAFAAVQAEGPSTVDSPPGFRDHTERWLATLGMGRWSDRTRFQVEPGPVPPIEYHIPADTSSAAYLWAAAALSPGSRVRTRGVSLNPGRTGFLDVLVTMGATVDRRVSRLELGDPVGDVTVVGAPLGAVRIAGDLAVRTIDELPLVAVCAGVAEGETRVTGAAELRAKESDRIAAIVDLLRHLGCESEADEDGFVIRGGGPYRGCRFDPGGDHRMAMAAAVASVAAEGEVTVDGFEAAAVSWPGFAAALEGLWS